MKKLSLPIRILILLIFLLSANNISAQNDFGVGGYVGGGFLSGNSTNVGSFTSSVFIQFKTPFSDVIYPRFSFFYTQDFDRLLPGSTVKYFPFIKGFTLKGIASQDISEKYYVEEGAGFAALNDHTFFDTNEWNYGIVSSLLIGMDFRKNKLSNGFRLGAGVEFAFSFANTFAKYYSFHVQTEYLF